ncbi:hypothetical protein NYE59_23955 [Paenibacillus sp. FSL L8-0323]|uniref:hypothetical protein n=1 Tax=Paenibacillus sp. FSL L8-0323 TaxID=2975330 RepID=UPI0030F5E3C2
MNQIPVQLMSAVISAAVAVLIFFALHFLIEPTKEKRKFAQERLQKLYSPLYALILARGRVYKDTMRNTPKDKVSLGSIKDHPFITREFMDEIIFKNMAYASTELMDSWSSYVSRGSAPLEIAVIENLIKVSVKDFHKLRKKLGLDYDETELKTGIPKIFED